MGFDMTEVRIPPQSFDELTVEDAREILQRVPEQKSKSVRMLNFENLAEPPDTYVFKTRTGMVGLLQFEAVRRGRRAHDSVSTSAAESKVKPKVKKANRKLERPRQGSMGHGFSPGSVTCPAGSHQIASKLKPGPPHFSTGPGTSSLQTGEW